MRMKIMQKRWERVTKQTTSNGSMINDDERKESVSVKHHVETMTVIIDCAVSMKHHVETMMKATIDFAAWVIVTVLIIMVSPPLGIAGIVKD